jgi:hypothetical protein
VAAALALARRHPRVALPALAFFGALGLWAFVLEPASLVTHREALEVRRWRGRCRPLVVALLGDLHVGSPCNGVSRLEQIAAQTREARPDLVLLAGDYVIHGVLFGRFVPPEAMVAGLGRLTAPLGVFAVLGNQASEAPDHALRPLAAARTGSILCIRTRTVSIARRGMIRRPLSRVVGALRTLSRFRPRRVHVFRLGAVLLSLGVAELGLRQIVPPPVELGNIHAPHAGLYGWAMPPRFEFSQPACTPTGEWIGITNSRGWKDVEHAIEKPPATLRILVLGDSHTFGFVPVESLYTRQLAGLLAHVRPGRLEVITIGVSGWGTDQELHALIHEGVLYRPDVVILQFCWNDVFNNLMPADSLPDRPGDSAWKPALDTGPLRNFRYELRGDGALVRRDLPRSLEVAVTSYFRLAASRFRVLGLVHTAWQALTARLRREGASPSGTQNPLENLPNSPLFYRTDNRFDAGMKAAWDLTEALIVRIRDVARSAGSAFALFCESGEEGSRALELRLGRLSCDGRGDYVIWQGRRCAIDYARPRRYLEEMGRRRGFAVIRNRRPYQRFRTDLHADVVGHQAMALDIAEFLLRWDEFRSRLAVPNANGQGT